VLFLIKNGVLLGTLKTLFGIQPDSMLFTTAAILLGMVYVYLPFMLFPMTLGISMVPNDAREAAFDLGASRWQVFREIELPLSTPGLVIGCLLTFVLAVGAIAEYKVLGGQQVIPITHDIEIAFTYAQNWPLGAALAVLLMVIVGVLVLLALRRFDLDRFLGRRCMETRASRIRRALIIVWTIAVVIFLYIPSISITLASLTASRYFTFPIPKWGLDWWQKTLDSIQIHEIIKTSLAIAAVVTVVAVVLAFFGALAFARYDWKGRTWYQKMVLLPIFFPQSVLVLLVQRARPPLSWLPRSRPSRLDRAGGDAGCLDPGLQLRPGTRGGGVRPRRDALAGDARDHHPGADAGPLLGRPVRLPPVVGELPAVALHHRRRHHGARVPLRQDGRGLHARRPGARHHLDHRRGGAADRRLSRAAGAQSPPPGRGLGASRTRKN
jgi:ABC-type spermidine/putrescine transport system permease subunit I